MFGPLLNGQLFTLSQRLVCLEVGYYCFANPDVSLLLKCLKGQLKPTRLMQEKHLPLPFCEKEDTSF
jgi:hypothetical protein